MTAPDVRPLGGGQVIPSYVSGQWYYNLNATGAATNTVTNQTLRLVPKYLPAVTFVSVNAEFSAIGQSGAILRVGLYADAGGVPGALAFELTSTTQIDANTLTPTAVTGSWSVPFAGLWWWGTVVQNAASTQPTVRTVAAGANDIPIPATWGGSAPASNASPQICLTQTGVSGALSGTPTIAGTGGFAPRLMLKTA